MCLLNTQKNVKSLSQYLLFVAYIIDFHLRIGLCSLPAVAKFMVSVLPIYLGYALFASLVFGQVNEFSTLGQVRVCVFAEIQCESMCVSVN